MSELYLLVFGCAVSFIAVAGGYVYVRECFTEEAQKSELGDKAADVVKAKFRESA